MAEELAEVSEADVAAAVAEVGTPLVPLAGGEARGLVSTREGVDVAEEGAGALLPMDLPLFNNSRCVSHHLHRLSISNSNHLTPHLSLNPVGWLILTLTGDPPVAAPQVTKRRLQ